MHELVTQGGRHRGVRLEVDSIERLGMSFAERVTEVGRNLAARGAPLRVAVSGGSVAQAFLPRLVGMPLAPRQIEVFFCDERAVPPSHPDSNFRLGKELWADPASIPPEHVHAFFSGSTLDESAQRYDALLRSRGERPLDVVLLGMGPDGHVASLFPGHPALESTRWTEIVLDAPKPPPERLTLTLPLLTSAPHIFLAAFGAAKAEVLNRALAGGSTLPVARVLARARRMTVLVDEALGGALV